MEVIVSDNTKKKPGEVDELAHKLLIDELKNAGDEMVKILDRTEYMSSSQTADVLLRILGGMKIGPSHTAGAVTSLQSLQNMHCWTALQEESFEKIITKFLDIGQKKKD